MFGHHRTGIMAALIFTSLLTGSAGAACISCHSDQDVLKKLVTQPKAAASEGEG